MRASFGDAQPSPSGSAGTSVSSIRWDLTRRLLGTIVPIVVLGGAAAFLLLRSTLVARFDETLASRAAAIVTLTQWDGDKIDFDFNSASMPWYEPGPHAEFYQIHQCNPGEAPGAEVRRSNSLGNAELGSADFGSSRTAVFDVKLPDGRPGRAIVLSFRPVPDDSLLPEGSERWNTALVTAPQLRLIAAAGCKELNRTIGTLLVGLVGAGIATGVGVALGVHWALRRGLRPLDHLAQEVQGLGEGSLNRRLDPAPLPAELRPVCTRLNNLLARLEVAFLQERRFTAAAAHELRTPVAELRSCMEVALSRPRTASETTNVMNEALAIALQMERMVASLLALARAEAGHEIPALAAVDLRQLLDRLTHKYAGRAKSRGAEIRVRAGGVQCALANEAMLESALDNLLANAIEYSDPGIISCIIHDNEADHSVSIEIANSARGVSREQVAALFQQSRRNGTDGSGSAHLGLGLPLARRLVEAMKGHLSAKLAEREAVCVRVSFPAAALPPRSFHNVD